MKSGTSMKRPSPIALSLVWSYLRPHRGRVALALLSLIVAAATVLAFGALLRALVDLGFGQNSEDALNSVLLIVLVASAVLAIASGARFFLVSWLSERVVADLRQDIFAHIIRLGPAWFEVKRSGDLMSRISADGQLIEQVVSSSATVVLRNAIMCIGGVVMLVATNPKLALFALVVVPLTVAPIILFGRHIRSLSRDAQGRVGDMMTLGGEILDAIRTVQAFAQEKAAATAFGGAAERAFRAARRRVAQRAMMTTLVIFIVFGAVGFLLWIGGQDVITGSTTGGDLSAFIFYAVLVASSGGSLSEAVGDWQRAAGAAERLTELLSETPSIAEPAAPKSLLRPLKGNVAFEGVSFRYPSRQDTLALDGLDLRAAPGETVAIVGPSGAGKTTVFNLLLRFYDAERGAIRIDGIDVRDLRLGELRRTLAIVPQDPLLFSATVADNIRYGRPDASDAEVRAAAVAAAAGFIDTLPNGFETHLGSRGVLLSGGQRQRIAIARAILCDPAILLLDEATSALDAESEQSIQHALARLTRGRTTIVIAHRLATVQKADRIVVMDHGRVVDTGRHTDLVHREGLYAHLAGLQFNFAAAAN